MLVWLDIVSKITNVVTKFWLGEDVNSLDHGV